MRKLLGLVAAAICLLAPAGASALSGRAIQIGASDDAATPAVVVDGAGTAYVAWTVPAAGDQSDPDEIDFCTIKIQASSCSTPGVLSAGPGNPAIGSLSLAIDGPDIVLVANQFLHSDDADDNYVNEWIAPDGSTSFQSVDGGASVSSGNGYTQNALFTLPDAPAVGGPLAYGWGEVGDGNGHLYDDVLNPFSAPPECSAVTCAGTPTADLGNPDGAETQTAQSYGVHSGTNPGVLGVFHTSFAASCASGPANAGLSYVYGTGDQSATNNYGISAGAASSAWRGGATIFDCDAGAGVADGGPAGLGTLEDNWKTDTLEYRVFDDQTGGFSTPIPVDSSEKATVTDLQASQDGTGGVFGTYYDGNSLYKGPNDLAYSPDGGLVWDGPVALTNLGAPLQESVSSVGSDGQGWLVWTVAQGSSTTADNVYIQQFSQQDVPADASKLFTAQRDGTKVAASLTIPAGTVGEYDQAALVGTNAKYATGTVQYQLVAGSCDPGLTLAKYNEGSETLAGGVMPASDHITAALAPGRYYWVDTYKGDRNNAAAVSACGSEVLTVTPPVTTTATAQFSSDAVRVGLTCATIPCSGTLSITTSAIATARRVSLKSKTTTVTLASGRFRETRKGRHTLSLRLTSAGRRFLGERLSRATTTIKIDETIKGHKIITTQVVKLAKLS